MGNGGREEEKVKDLVKDFGERREREEEGRKEERIREVMKGIIYKERGKKEEKGKGKRRRKG